jgi:uncharacterized cupin superfamily protein
VADSRVRRSRAPHPGVCNHAAVRKVNLLKPEFDRSSERAGYRWRAAIVGRALGSSQIGARVYELEAGERTLPFHFHHAEEEWLVVITGAPALRGPDGERALREGDVVCFPRGPAGAHQVTGPGTVLMLAANAAFDTIEYPDSGKIQVRPSGQIFRLADAVDYWDGE